MFSNLYENPYSSYNPYSTAATADAASHNPTGEASADAQTPAAPPSTKSAVPMTVQLIKSRIQTKDTSHFFFGKEIRNIVLVGIVSCEKTSQVANYLFHDGTGSIKCKLYIGESNQEMAAITNCYARIIGNISYINGTYSVNVHHIERVVDLNCVMTHLLNAIASFVYYKRRDVSAAATNEIPPTPSDISSTVEMMVTQALRTLLASTPSGASLEAIVSSLSPYGLSREQVQGALSDMERDMKVYCADVNTYVLNT
ncbi:hypothetical protein WA577_000372 [Blastocystis sp. JDR]